VLPLFITALCLAIMICIFATTRMLHQIGMPGILGFPILASGAASLIFNLFALSHEMEDLSAELVREGKEACGKRDSYEYRAFECYRLLSVRARNFFEVKNETRVTFLQFTIDGAIDAMLTI
jgi:hypothetical protein